VRRLGSDVFAGRLRAFHQGLSETGYVEGKNVAIEYRWAENQHDRFPALLADLVRREVTVIVAVTGTPPALAAKAATTTIPIVFVTGGDPVALGLVPSLNRPGGNITGFSFITGELGAKRLGLLRELRPGATRIAVLVDPKWPPAERFVSDVRVAASASGQQIEVLYVGSEREIETAFTTLVQRGAGALVSGTGRFFLSQRERIVALAARHRTPRSMTSAQHCYHTIFSVFTRLTPGLAGRNRVGGTMGASATHWRAAHVNWFTQRGWRKRYRHRYARACVPILSVGSGAHSRDHAVDRTGGSDLGAVPHR
jgi:hypothetical protein